MLFIVIQENNSKNIYILKNDPIKKLLEVDIFINTSIRTQAVTHPSTNQAHCCLTSVLRWVLLTLRHIGRFPNLTHRLLMALNLYLKMKGVLTGLDSQDKGFSFSS